MTKDCELSMLMYAWHDFVSEDEIKAGNATRGRFERPEVAFSIDILDAGTRYGNTITSLCFSWDPSLLGSMPCASASYLGPEASLLA